MRYTRQIIASLLFGSLLYASAALGRPAVSYPFISSSLRTWYESLRDSLTTDSLLGGKDTMPLPAQPRRELPDTLRQATPPDSIVLGGDTLPTALSPSLSPTDTGKGDSLQVEDSTQMRLEAPVEFTSKDSLLLFPRRNLVRMYGDASVQYEKQTLKGDYMHLLTDSGMVYSTYIDYPDSLQRERVYASIQDGDQTYEAKSISYNFNTHQGYITDAITQQGEGYITASRTKRMANDELYMADGKYTTCPLHDHPHFYIALTKAKVRPNKNLVSGPLYLVFADVPIPIGLPFAFFPFTQSRTSGFIMPSYGDEMDRGLYFRNGGYYLAINDYVNLTLTGDIYSKGSWGVNLSSDYRKRYRYNGSFNASYLVTKRGDKIAGDYSKATDIRVAWRHSQDPKANPYRTFSANVNFSTSSYNHNNLDGLYNQAVLGQNTKSSSVSYTRRFPNSPFTLSASFDITQRSRDSMVAITSPNLSISMSRIYPFKRKKVMGKERWYEKISMSYSGLLRNSIDTKERLLLKSNIIRDWRNGMSHSVPISASFDLFNYFKISPSFSYTERWYTSKTRKAFDPALNRSVVTDTIYGFNRVYDYNASLSLSTTIYGFWKPLSIFGDKINMIRHRMEPSISLSYRPDFGAPGYGYWERLSYFTSDGREVDEYYSPYSGQLFGVPGMGKSGSIGISVNNNLEAKVKDSKDSTEFKKISLIDGLSLSTNYNMAADSFAWSDLSTSLRLRLSQSFTLSLNGTFDVYTYDYYEKNGRVIPVRKDKLRALSGKGLGRLRSTGTSFSYSLNPQSLKKLLQGVGLVRREEDKETNPREGAPRRGAMVEEQSEGPSRGGGGGSLFSRLDHSLGDYDEDGYLKNDLNWNIGFSYSMSLGYGEFNPKIREYAYKLRHDLSFNGQFTPTKNWNFNFSANYNFEERKITNMTCNISRDLHCWSMTASFIPMGPYKSYNFSVAVKSQMLQDLKYRQSNSPRNRTNERWY